MQAHDNTVLLEMPALFLQQGSAERDESRRQEVSKNVLCQGTSVGRRQKLESGLQWQTDLQD